MEKKEKTDLSAIEPAEFNIQTKDVLVNKDHVYQVGEEFLPSVTTILTALAKGKGFNVWLQNHSVEESEEILEQAGLAGSKVHTAIKLLLEGKRIVPGEFIYIDDEGAEHTGLTIEESNKLVTFMRWWYEFQPKVLAFEKIVYSETKKYAGTVDFVGSIKLGVLYEKKAIKEKPADPKAEAMLVIDWKTNKSGIYLSNIMQAAAYAMAESEMTGKKVDRIAVLRLGTKHKIGYEFKVIDRILEPYKAFLGVMEAWKYENPNFGPRIIKVPLYFELPTIVKVEVKDIKKRKKPDAPESNKRPIQFKHNKKGQKSLLELAERDKPLGLRTSPG